VVSRHDLQRYSMIERQKSRLLVHMTPRNLSHSQHGAVMQHYRQLGAGAFFLWGI
jgi:hypothetical protein